jgi:hypothetical protein
MSNSGRTRDASQSGEEEDNGRSRITASSRSDTSSHRAGSSRGRRQTGKHSQRTRSSAKREKNRLKAIEALVDLLRDRDAGTEWESDRSNSQEGYSASESSDSETGDEPEEDFEGGSRRGSSRREKPRKRRESSETDSSRSKTWGDGTAYDVEFEIASSAHRPAPKEWTEQVSSVDAGEHQVKTELLVIHSMEHRVSKAGAERILVFCPDIPGPRNAADASGLGASRWL